MTSEYVAVIDIGKTNAKLALLDTSDFTEISVLTCSNRVLNGPPYPHFDVDAIWSFLLDGLSEYHKRHRVDAISITTHGAAGAFIGANGHLAAPILDYEHVGPETSTTAYEILRPTFEETGSPRLPMGLNLGAQFHWQLALDTTLIDRTKAIVTYPQYWGHRLTGECATDVTSLGCHTDLWNPFEAKFSTLVDRMDLAAKMAPARMSSDVLGTLLPGIAERTGLNGNTPVFCGIHDSNASLLPHIMLREPPFSVVSTGTWVIVMTVGVPQIKLDPSRDTLINVNAMGAPVPSARFMGGREFESIMQGQSDTPDKSTMRTVAETGALLMPAVVPESGPFQGRLHRWIGSEPEHGSTERAAAASFYLAMMTAECLGLTNHCGTIVVEGPFAKNPTYCGMLSAATDCAVEAAETVTGTSQGAAMLACGGNARPKSPSCTRYRPSDYAFCSAYAARWRGNLTTNQGK